MPSDLERSLAAAVQNPEAALRQLDKADAEEKLIDFIALLWPVLEPGREFLRGWAVEAICDHLEAVSAGQIKRLLINVPPGCMKSLTTNVFWPAWEWGPRSTPSMRYVSAAYAQELTIRDNRKCRTLVQSELYRELWGDRVSISAEQAAKSRFDTTATGFKVATSVGGMGTGERGDRFIIDDPHNVKEAESDAKRAEALFWFAEVVPTRINDPERSAIVVIMQRVHENDVSGMILAEELGYDHLCLPMDYEVDHPTTTSTAIYFSDPRTEDGELLWPERFTREHLENELKPQLRAIGGDYAVAGQLQQRPAPRGGGMFKRDWFQIVDAPPDKVRTRVRGWDFAGTDKKSSPYTAGVLMSRDANGVIFIEDVVAAQAEPGEVENMLKRTADMDGRGVIQDIPQDPGQAGKSQVRHFAALLAGHDVRSSTESGSKEQRAQPLAAQAQNGNVRLVRGPWNGAFIGEAESFPVGTFKDRIDAASRAFARIVARKPRKVGRGPELITG